jgi:hypothetical protein
LHRLDQDVHQSQSVALLLALAPRQVRREHFAVHVLPAVVLAPRLLGAVLEVGLEGVVDRREPLEHVLDAGGASPLAHVSDQGEQRVTPEHHVRVQNFGYVGEELLPVDLGEELVRLQISQAREEQLQKRTRQESDYFAAAANIYVGHHFQRPYVRNFARYQFPQGRLLLLLFLVKI